MGWLEPVRAVRWDVRLRGHLGRDVLGMKRGFAREGCDVEIGLEIVVEGRVFLEDYDDVLDRRFSQEIVGIAPATNALSCQDAIGDHNGTASERSCSPITWSLEKAGSESVSARTGGIKLGHDVNNRTVLLEYDACIESPACCRACGRNFHRTESACFDSRDGAVGVFRDSVLRLGVAADIIGIGRAFR
jgi:hypothetical protein